jgi:hypothetical protein
VRWIEGMFHRRGEARLALIQVAQIPLFRFWQCLESYRLEVFQGAYAIILPPEGSRNKSGRKELLSVFAIPKEATTPAFYPVNLSTSDAPLRDARNAALSIFCGFALGVFLLCWVFMGRKRHRLRFSLLLCISWALMMGILLFLGFASPFDYPQYDRVLVPSLWALVIAPLVLALYAIAVDVSVSLRAWCQGHEWGKLLRESDLYLLIGSPDKQGYLKVEGPSFGVSLCLSILLGVQIQKPVNEKQSWLWWLLFDQMAKNLKKWGCTGEVTAAGWIKPVDRIRDKFEAALVDTSLNNIITPFQGEARRRVVKEVCRDMAKRSRFSASLHVEAWQAACARRLRLRRCFHLAQVLMAVGGLKDSRAVAANALLAGLLLVGVATFPANYEHICPPPLPDQVVEKFWTGHDIKSDGDRLNVYIKTDYPADFLVLLNSRYWVNRQAQFYKDPENPELCVAVIKLDKLDNPLVNDSLDAEILIVRPRQLNFGLIKSWVFQFRELPFDIIGSGSRKHIVESLKLRRGR